MTTVVPALRLAAYLVVQREQNPQILNEFLHSFLSLRRFHPDLPVCVYHENLTPAQLDFVRALPNVLDFPIAVDRSGRFAPHPYRMRNGWFFPQLYVLAAKIDVLLQTPGDTLFLDTDTEVRSSLDEVLESTGPWMHAAEALLREHERKLGDVLAATDWAAFGWRGDRDRLRMFNSGALWVPERLKVHLYRAKEFLWSLIAMPAAARGDNRLDEQLALSIALQEAADYAVREVSPRVYHFWQEKYDNAPRWYVEHFAANERDGHAGLTPPDPRLLGLAAHGAKAAMATVA